MTRRLHDIPFIRRLATEAGLVTAGLLAERAKVPLTTALLVFSASDRSTLRQTDADRIAVALGVEPGALLRGDKGTPAFDRRGNRSRREAAARRKARLT